MAIDPEIRVTVRIEKYNGASHEAVNGHASGFTGQVEALIEEAKKGALSLVLGSWLKKL